MADWNNLSIELLELVPQRLTHITDYVFSGAVCVTWRSVSVKNHISLPRQIPVLMIPSDHKEEKETRRFYSLTEKRVCNFRLQVPPNYDCRGSTENGWLVIVDEWRSMRLLNPFSRNKKEIQLPSLSQTNLSPFPVLNPHLYKAILSSSPGSTLNFDVLAIFRGYPPPDAYVRDVLALYRSGDKAWIVIEQKGLFRSVDDTIFYNQKFYVVDCHGDVITCDVGHPRPSLTRVASQPLRADGYSEIWRKRYLVESLGDLLQVKKITYPLDQFDGFTRRFRVFKLDLIEENWVEVKSLGNQTLFLGINTSLSLSASDFPDANPTAYISPMI